HDLDSREIVARFRCSNHFQVVVALLGTQLVALGGADAAGDVGYVRGWRWRGDHQREDDGERKPEMAVHEPRTRSINDVEIRAALHAVGDATARHASRHRRRFWYAASHAHAMASTTLRTALSS